MNRIITIFFVLIAGIASGQGDYRFEQITNESGRSLGFVSQIVQDSSGFIWLATRNGLYRYDGYSYKLFKHDRKDSTSLPHNDITYLYLDWDKNLWMRHYKKLFAFNDQKVLSKFKYVNEKTFDINTKILQDKFRNYWIGRVKDIVIKLNADQTQADTFSMATKLAHPAIKKWVSRNEPTYFTDSVLSLNIEKKTSFLIVSGGEGSYGRYYDFGQLLQNNQVVFDAKEYFAPSSKDALFYMAAKMIELDAGNYELKFVSDESNSFKPEENPMPRYGIGLYKVSQESEIARLSEIEYFPDNSIHAEKVKDMLINSEGYLALLTDNGIHIRKSDSWHSIPIDFEKYLSGNIKSDSYHLPFIQAKNGDYWIAHRNGLLRVNQTYINNYQLFNNKYVISLTEDHEKQFWIGTTKGLYIFDIRNGSLKHIEQSNDNRLYHNEIWDIYEDRSRNKWFASRGGLNRLRPSWFHIEDFGMEIFVPFPILQIGKDSYFATGETNKIYHFSIGSRKSSSLDLDKSIFVKNDSKDEYVYDINDIVNYKDKLYMAYSSRVAVFDYPIIEKRKVTELEKILVDDQEVDNHALFILNVPDGIWVAALDGLHKYDFNLEKRENFLSFGDSYNSFFDLDSRYIKDIDKWGKIFFFRTARNIWKFDPAKQALEKVFDFPDSIQQTSLANGDSYLDTSDNSLWFSVIPDMYRYHIENEVIDTFSIELEADLGDCYTKRIDSLVWIATNNGLIRFNPQTNDFIHYTSGDGLADNNINGVYPDIHGNLWLTSLKGLTKMSVEDEKTETFFRSNEYLSLNFLKTHYRHPEFPNQLILPTTAGYMAFNPDSLNPIKPPIVLSRILLFGKEAEFDSLAHEKRFIELPYNQNFITFELASLDYTDPSKNMYRYKMENFNEQWIYADANSRKAPYTGMPPGDYVFIAQGTNNDGTWSDPLRVTLIIHPPWYRTVAAYISYVVFIILSIVLFIRYRERKLKEEKRILEEKVKERTIEIRKQRDEIAEQKKDITDSIHYASRIQSALLPSQEFAKSILNSYFILFKPRDIVSGDYYWLTQIENKTIVVAADCTGHGVPGAFMSMLGVAFLNEIIVRDGTLTTNEILNRLREYVIKSLKQTGEEGGSKDGMDIALTIIDHSNMEAQFSGAYNPLLVLRDGEIETIKADKMPIGYHIKVDSPFTSKNVKLQKGDRLYTFSDGYPDQFGGEKGRKFMSKRFKQLLIDTGDLPMDEQKNVLDKEIEAWMGTEHQQIDDILVVGIEI